MDWLISVVFSPPVVLFIFLCSIVYGVVVAIAAPARRKAR